ncbi:MAG: MATE family efflux transporter [Bacteroides sp.]|nr:MATE family efflux transporter [Bacteroides sp.]MBQ8874844.1 MATE family efflux transporter [Bacteroides sp.]
MKGIKDLTEGHILKQLFTLAMPIMATSFIQMAYSLTDMAWVGRLGSEAIAAVGSVGLLTWMTTSLALLNKVGAEVSVGQAIGMKDDTAAHNFATHNLTLSLIISSIWAIILFSFAPFIIRFYELKEHISSDAINYLRIVSTAFPFVFMSASFTGIFNAAGRSKIPFTINGIGLLTNMILDPLFIFVFDWETDGAALATWIAQACVFTLFIYQLKIRKILWEDFHILGTLERTYTARIIKIGLPVATLNTLFAFVNMFLGRTASTVGGHIGLMAMTTSGQIEAITWNTSQGFSTALSAFVAQNYAAKKISRVMKALKSTLFMTLIFGFICSLLFIFCGNNIFAIFVPEKEAYEAGGLALRIDGYSQLFMMLEIVIQGVFFGMGRTIPPAIISISCNYLRIPMALLFVSFGWGLSGIWWTICLTSILKGIIILIWFLFIKRKTLDKMTIDKNDNIN